MKRGRLAVLALASLCLAFGCQGRTKSQMPPLHPVHGIVTKDGKPVKEAFVQFVPDIGSEHLTINGTSNAEGKFEIMTLFVQGAANEKKPGAPEGSYTVMVMMPLDAQQQLVEQKTLLEKYQVKPGSNDFPLELNPKKK
jgi:hypothetical protein